MQERHWKATWTSPKGESCIYLFYAPDNRVIAGIDFRLKLMEQGKDIPERFTLEEGRLMAPVAPTLSEVARREQI